MIKNPAFKFSHKTENHKDLGLEALKNRKLIFQNSLCTVLINIFTYEDFK